MTPEGRACFIEVSLASVRMVFPKVGLRLASAADRIAAVVGVRRFPDPIIESR